MKLRNKKTGEIVEPFGIICVNGRTFVRFNDGKGTFKFEAHSLAELNEVWEDVPEELKEHWYIDDAGVIQIDQVLSSEINMRKSIGNYFLSREEAEKALENLKAWKRLKDDGFEFDGIILEGSNCLIKTKLKHNIRVPFDKAQQFYEDVILLFGDEE